MQMPIAISRRTLALAVLAAGLAAALATLLATQLGGPAPAAAADHLDAPGLTPPGGDKRADITDIYAFQSPTNANRTALIVNVNPATAGGQAAYFGRNVPGVAGNKRIAYWFNIDNDGDAVADVRYRLVFGKPKNGVQSFELRRNGAILIPFGRGRTTALGANPRVVNGGGASVTAGVFDDPFFFDLNGFLNITAPLDGDPANDRSRSSVAIRRPADRTSSPV